MTVLNDRYRYLFIHIPKTAGKSVKASLLKSTFSHADQGRFAVSAALQSMASYASPSRADAIRLPSPLVFGPGVDPSLAAYAYRNGYRTTAHLTAVELSEALGEARYESLYTFTFVRNPWARCLSAYFYFRKKRLHPCHGLASRLSFDEFLVEMNQRSLDYIGQQTRWLCDSSGACKVDFIGRMETIDDDMAEVFRRIGLAQFAPLGRINTSRPAGMDYRQYYSNAAKDLVSILMADDIARLGYEF